MAYVSTSRIAGAQGAGTFLGRLQAAIARYDAALERRRVYARTLHELRQLTDRELADLGIARISIADVAREAAYGK
jgi:uncharacterized protein YjiS (DUF1127 family)